MTSRVEREVGRQVATYRRAAGWSQEHLAEMVKVARETISRLERGATIPSLKTLETIASALGVTLGDLVAPPGASRRSTKDELLDALIHELRQYDEPDIRLVRDLAHVALARSRDRWVVRRSHQRPG